MATASASPDAAMEGSASSFTATRDKLSEFLIQATLIESYHSFVRHAKPYPFAARESLQPGASMASFEHPFQRSALVLIVDGALPANLRKHIRFRRANELSADNLSRLAPEIAMALPPPVSLAMGDPGFPALLDRLLDLDYALLMQRASPSSPITLSHMHVKVERLTDNAVRLLASDLGYIRRTLYESGEAHAEMLERKYFEYFGFGANASGRKCAAAMAAQLLGADVSRFAVFATCQEDCRLTMLDDSESVTHHLLIRVKTKTLRAIGAEDLENYVIDAGRGANDESIVCYRGRLCRTAAARPLPAESTARPDSGLNQPWLAITEQTLLPLPGHHAPALSFDWVGD
ncbi:MAG: hypothetical protein O3B21_04670 [Proteobacteria bacterium]|nr:hypothetical protein [Pseudomonadota bacterium]MDA1356219.1 hypothetical protein [Pseudomonadota bacterium]